LILLNEFKFLLSKNNFSVISTGIHGFLCIYRQKNSSRNTYYVLFVLDPFILT